MITTTDNNPERVPTGVPGLDAILHGGFLRNGFYLLQGDPGSGKTTMAIQFMLECVGRGERCLYINLSETEEDMRNVARSHGWNLEGIEICDLSLTEQHLSADAQYTIFHPSEVELGETTQSLLAEVERVKPKFVVFDGLSEVRLLSRDPLQYRRQLLALKQYFAAQQITALLLDDRTNPSGEIAPESLVGGNILLEQHSPEYGAARRRLRVTKTRGSDFHSGFHDYDIQQGGAVVYPRLVLMSSVASFETGAIKSEVEDLDKMLGVGLERGTTTVFLGPAGVGKSTIAMQFAVAALRQGQRAAIYTFDEVLHTLFQRAEKLSQINFAEYMAQDLLHVQQVDPAELSPGAFAREVHRVVDELGVKLLVIDSLNGYMNAMPGERFLLMHLHELFAYLNQKGVVTIVIVAQHGLLNAPASDVDTSYLADNVLLLRHIEVNGEVKQAIGVVKKRSGNHDRALRELRIDDTGIHVGDPLRQLTGDRNGHSPLAQL